jgi:hypothetical protein
MMKNSIDLPVVASLKIDKLAIVFKKSCSAGDIAESCRAVIKKLRRDQVAQKVYLKGARYRINYRIELGGDSHCLLQFDPLQDKDANLRVEFNPDKAGENGVKQVVLILKQIFLTEYDRALRLARITRIDLAVDVNGVNLDQLIIFDLHKRSTRCFFDQQGKLESQYLGSPTSEEQFCIYNKTRQMKVSYNVDLDQQIMRVELRCKKSLSMSELLTMRNPFSSLNISAVGEVSDGDSWIFRWFLDSCARRTANAALRIIADSRKREKYRFKLAKRYLAGWWKPTEIWEKLPVVLKGLKLFPDIAVEE